MARSRTPSDDPAMKDFQDELARCTLYTPDPPIACGRPYVRVSHLTRWFRSAGPREDGSITTQARRLLDYAYRQWPEYSRTDPMPTTKLFDPSMGCIVIFSILLKLDRGCLVHLFRRQQRFDHNLPIHVRDLNQIFYAMLEPASEHNIHFDPAALATAFDDLQWSFCPARFELGEEQIFHHKQIIPIIEKSKLSESGGTAVLWQIAVLEDFVADNLAAVVEKSRYREPGDPQGYRYHFALKTFKEGNKRPYLNEVDAFHSIPHQGMIRYLGGYIQSSSQRASLPQSGLHTGPAPRETYNILLEFGDCDLETVFDEEMVPLVLQGDIDRFWISLFQVAKTLEQIHFLKNETDGMRKEFWGWHADIKPSNIIEIDGQFKLADPGFAIFKEKSDPLDDSRPTAEMVGGTSTYSAPEQTCRAGTREFYQTIDVWALACVFSIAATWIAVGHQGVRQYAQLREAANRRVVRQQSKRGSMLENVPLGHGDYFHDGRDVLPEVTDWHRYLRNILRGTDRITAQVLDVVDHYMFLQDPRQRWQSSEVYEKLSRISLGLEDSTSTVPPGIAEFISTNELCVSGGPGTTYHNTELPVNQDVVIVRSRRDQKSKYLLAPITKGTGLIVNSSQAAISVERSPSPPIETSVTSDSRIMSRPYVQSPIQTTSFLSTTEDRPETPVGKHRSEVVQIKLPTPAAFRGKVQDIFQAFEEIEESERKRNKIRLMGKRQVDDYLARHYQKRDIQFFVDNSWSMFKHWAHVKFVLKTLATKAKGLDPDGVDLYFALGGVKAENKTGVKQLMEAMVNPKAMPPSSNDGLDTDMATRLKDLFDEHLTRVRRSRKNGSESATKLTIIVLTNGMWDEVQVAKRIVEFAKALKELTKKDIDDRPVSIEFVQFGRDIRATKRLKRLDDELKFQGIPDLVDTEHAEGNVYKMLLGSFVPVFDEQEADSTKESDAATIRPSSASPKDYFERHQSTIVSTYGPPPSLGSYTQDPLPYRPGPRSSSHEINQLENNRSHRNSSQHTNTLRQNTREDQRCFTGSSSHHHHPSSSSRDSFYHL